MMRRIKPNRDGTLDILNPKKYYILADFGCSGELKLLGRIKTCRGIRYGLISIWDDNPTDGLLEEKSLQSHARRLIEIIKNLTYVGIIEVDLLDEIIHKSRMEIEQFLKDTGGNIID